MKDGYRRGDKVWLVDFDCMGNNDLVVTNQFTVTQNNITKRPDVVLLVNGLPLVVIELKNPVDENATVTKLRVMSRHQQLMRLDFEDGFIGQDLSLLEKAFEEQVQNHNIVVCSDYGKGSLRQVNRLIQICNEKNVPVLVDPKGSDFEKYSGANLITPNLSEFETVVGKCNTEEELVAKANILSQKFNIEALLVTRSEHGMSLMQQDYG